MVTSGDNLAEKIAVAAPLGIYAKCVSPLEDVRLLRWALQAEAQAIMSKEVVAKCLKVPHSLEVQVLRDQEHQAAHYGGLVTCGSVWMCPLCAAKIAERRREELARAVLEINNNNGAVFMATYTIRHSKRDSLASLLTPFLSAHRKTKAGKGYKTLQARHGLVGTIRCLEVTWSRVNGWHPHVHELVMVGNQAPDPADLERDLRRAWSNATAREGLEINIHGFKLNRTFGAVQDYIAKYGREPLHRPWGAEDEMSKAHIKRGRGEEHYTPFGLLQAINQGEERLEPVFHEFATWFKGKRQLQWSQGLKAMLLSEPEKSDEEIVAEEREDAILLGRLTRDQWRAVIGNDVRGDLLEVARSGEWDQVVSYLVGLGVEM